MIRLCGCSRPSARTSGQANTKSPSAPEWRIRTFRRSMAIAVANRSLLGLLLRLGVGLGGAFRAAAVARAFAGVAGLRTFDGLLLPRPAIARGALQIRIERPPPVLAHAALHQ